MASGLEKVAARQKSIAVDVAGVKVGGTHPIVVQSMTNTDTANIEATVDQICNLAKAGSELVRITVDREESAWAVPHIRDELQERGVSVPLVGDFHYIGHKLLADYPACARALDKYRINPGNVGFKDKKDGQFAAIVEQALKWDKPVRIGVNWGSLDSELLTRLMDENAKATRPMDARGVTHEAIVQSALLSADQALNIGLPADRIIISAKVSAVQDLIAVYSMLAKRSRFALHVGLTEAGMGSKGIVASSAAMGVLLQQGIGDTIRFSLTPEPGGDRTVEVRAAQELLQTMGLRSFVPIVTACPGCGRTTSTVFQELASDVQNIVRDRMPEWKTKYPGVEELKLAVMGCIVNGPGESKHADIGISLPGTGEEPAAPVFVDGKKFVVLRGANISADFKVLVEEYVEKRYGAPPVVSSEALLPDDVVAQIKSTPLPIAIKHQDAAAEVTQVPEKTTQVSEIDVEQETAPATDNDEDAPSENETALDAAPPEDVVTPLVPEDDGATGLEGSTPDDTTPEVEKEAVEPDQSGDEVASNPPAATIEPLSADDSVDGPAADLTEESKTGSGTDQHDAETQPDDDEVAAVHQNEETPVEELTSITETPSAAEENSIEAARETNDMPVITPPVLPSPSVGDAALHTSESAEAYITPEDVAEVTPPRIPETIERDKTA